jgi:hypothetical protein
MVWYKNLKKSQYLHDMSSDVLSILGPRLTAAQLLVSMLDIHLASANFFEPAEACPHPEMS